MLNIGAGRSPEHNNSNPALLEEHFQTDLPVEIQLVLSDREFKASLQRRHPLWLKAQKTVNSWIYTLDDLAKYENTVKDLAQKYYEETKTKSLLIYNADEDKLLSLPYRTRFDPSYEKKYLRRIKKLRKSIGHIKARSSFLTITFDPKTLNTLSDYKHVFGKNLSILLDDIHRVRWIDLRKIKKQDREKYRRLKARKGYKGFMLGLELQKNGNMHVHILLIGCPYIPKEWLQQREKELGFGFEQIRELKGPISDAINYAMKYIGKSLSTQQKIYNDGGDNLEDRIFLLKAVLWSLNMRQLRFSRSFSLVGLFSSSRLISQNSWQFIGTCPPHLLPSYGIIDDPLLVEIILNRLYLGFYPRKPPDKLKLKREFKLSFKLWKKNKDGFYECPICGYEFYTKTDLEAHLNFRHPKK